MSDANNAELVRFLGLVLAAIGGLWLALTGLCTLGVLGFVVGSYSLTLEDIQIIIVVAAPSALIGWGLYALGQRLRRRR